MKTTHRRTSCWRGWQLVLVCIMTAGAWSWATELCPAQDSIPSVSSEVGWSDEKWETLEGEPLSIFRQPDERVWVLVFISPDCPIANAYHPMLKELSRQYQSKGVRFALVHSNQSTTQEQARQHADEFELNLPIVLDHEQKLARLLKAKATPEAFVLLRDDHDPAYRGKIDNGYEGYGKKRPQANRHYLQDALQQILSDQAVTTTVTKPVGCFIEYAADNNDQNEDPISEQEADVSKTPFVITSQAPGELAWQDRERSGYDPLDSGEHEKKELDLDDKQRGRKVPIRIYAPKPLPDRMPVIVLSHGLGGSRQGCTYLGEQWSGRGYLVVAVQHPGSDETVWKGVPRRQIMAEMKKAANGENLVLRAADITFVLDQLEDWNQQEKHWLYDRLDLKHVGMSGHSFGAVTTQAVCGQRYMNRPAFQDTRITAALPLSPSTARVGTAKAAFSQIAIPWLSMTGTQDNSPIEAGSQPESRREVYANLPDGDKYELVLEGAQHYAFGDTSAGRNLSRNPNHHKVIKALSSAFWDAYLREDPQAKDWLTGPEVTSLLEEKDVWSHK